MANFSIEELKSLVGREAGAGDWFTAREVRGFSEEGGWTSFRKQVTHQLDGKEIGPSQFLYEG